MNNLFDFPCPPATHDSGASTGSPPDADQLVSSLRQVARHLELGQRGISERERRIRNFRSERYELTDDLIVLLEEQDGQYIASSLDTGQYGHGFSPDDAVLALCEVIEEYYDLLCEDEDSLSPPLRSHLRYLRNVLRERQ